MSSSPPPDTTRAPERISSISALVDEPRPEDLPSADDAEAPARAPKRRLRDRYAKARARLVPWSAWTLRAKLVASMLALFTILSLATGAVTVLTLNNQLTSQVDEQLGQSITRNLSGGPLPDFSVTEDNERRSGGPGDEGLIAFLPTQPTTLFPNPVGAATSLDARRRNLTTAQLAILAQSGLGRDATDVQLGGSLGNYRAVAAYTTLTPRGLPPMQGTPGVLIVGLPTTPNEHTVQRMAVLAISTVAAGLVLVFVLGSWIVRRNLEPLQRVADTATRVSRMPLSTGKVALAERVDPVDTDTRTEVGQVGAAFNEMLDHVDEALNSRHQSEQRVRQFVADASHELRTPLASIKGYAELSRREPEEVPTSVTHAMGRIESEASRMSSLVEDLLLLARLDAGRPLEQKPVDLSMIVINAISDAHAASSDHVWDLDLPPEPIEVTGDTARLHQVVVNLLANARTHTPAGTRVTTSIRRDADWVRLTVHDNGPGVPVALQPNVFERFARGDDARNRVGGSTGLGLSIVAAVAKALGGRVELASRPGDTTFSVLLPAAPAAT